MVFITFVGLMALMLFMSFFSKGEEEAEADSEANIVSIASEAEKETLSADDTINATVALLIFLVCYGCFTLCAYVNQFGEHLMFFVCIPAILFSILLLPLSLLFDFGLFFAAYLRGCGGTASMLFELVYDYVGVLAYFVRLLVQFIRLLIVVMGFLSLQEAIVASYKPDGPGTPTESFLEELSHVEASFSSISYYLANGFFNRLLYLNYEMVHFLFLISVQLTAFFAMVFWLYFLFYSFYCAEKCEMHIRNIKEYRSIMLRRLCAISRRKRIDKGLKLYYEENRGKPDFIDFYERAAELAKESGKSEREVLERL